MMRSLSPYKPNSQEAQRYSLPPVRRETIELSGDRSQGEFLPQLEGEYLYVESCDIPCALVPVSQDSRQVVFAREGQEYHGPFKGVTLFHPNIALTNSSAKLVLVISRIAALANQLHEPGTRYITPMIRNFTAGAGGNTLYTLPVPRGARYARVRACTDVTFAAAFNSRAIATVDFQSLGSGGASVILPHTLTQGPTNYNLRGSVVDRRVCTVSVIEAATFRYTAEVEFPRVPIPTEADNMRLTIAVDGTVNFVSEQGGVSAQDAIKVWFQ